MRSDMSFPWRAGARRNRSWTANTRLAHSRDDVAYATEVDRRGNMAGSRLEGAGHIRHRARSVNDDRVTAPRDSRSIAAVTRLRDERLRGTQRLGGFFVEPLR